MQKVKVAGTRMDSSQLRGLGPGIWDDDNGCQSNTRHVVVMPDDTVFDLGPAEETSNLLHIFKKGTDTGKHISLDQLEITS